MPDSLLAQVVVGLVVFVAFPALIVWQRWDSLSARRLMSALLLFGAGALGAFLLMVAAPALGFSAVSVVAYLRRMR